MRRPARWATLALWAVGCGAAPDRTPPATAIEPPPTAAATPPPPPPACVPEAVRAAVAACPPHRAPKRRGTPRPSLPQPSPRPLTAVAGALPASDPCARQARLAEAALAKGPAFRSEAEQELEKQLAVYRNGAPDPAWRSACASVTAPLLIETAMAWHFEAVGSGGVSGTGDAATIVLAARLYEIVVAAFPRDAIASLTFPHLAREDWPTLSRLRYALADLRYFARDWSRCGPAFDAVVTEDPDGPLADEASYAAVLCYQGVYTDAHRKGAAPPAASDDGGEGQRGMLSAFGRYLCSTTPDPAQHDAYVRWVEIAYARARSYFEAGRFQEAAVAFRDVAMSHSGTEVGIYAAHLYLECLNVLATDKQAPLPCYTDMAADVPRFVKLYCSGDPAKLDDSCSILLRIQGDLDRLHAGH
jgi:hypothetical protein